MMGTTWIMAQYYLLTMALYILYGLWPNIYIMVIVYNMDYGALLVAWIMARYLLYGLFHCIFLYN